MKGTVKVERVGNRIHARIPYADGDGPRFAKKVTGARWSPEAKVWTYPLEWVTCVALRQVFGNGLEIGPELWAWATDARRASEKMMALGKAQDADLEHLPRLAPKLYEAIKTRPYQLVGSSFIATGRQVLLADEMRLGKTLQAIAGLIEAHPQGGTFLVFPPKTAVLATWKPELERWVGYTAEILTMHGDRKQREAALALANRPRTQRFRFVIGNIEMARIKGIEDNRTKTGGRPEYPGLFSVAWDGFIVDESHLALVHKTGQPTQTRVGMRRLAEQNPTAFRLALSGTPFRGKRHRIWGTLNWLKPELYTSYWRWLEQYFDVSSNGYGREIGDLKPEMEQAFYRELDTVMLRRTQAEVRPEIAGTLYGGTPLDGDSGPIGVWLDMEPKQAQQYKRMASQAALDVDGGEIMADGILAELTRAKQLADSCLSVADEQVQPVLPSNKWTWILNWLEEAGIAGEQDGDSKVIIATQYTKLVDVMDRELAALGIDHRIITGNVSATNRAKAQREFQAPDGPRVMLLNTTAGGTSLTLDRARAVIIIDETWVDDDQKQVEARITATNDETGKVAPTVYYLKSRGTIDEGIARNNLDAASLIRTVMDGRRGVEAMRRLLDGKEVK